MTQTPSLFTEDVTPVAIGMFPVSRDAIINEIKQRTADDNVCGNGMLLFHFYKPSLPVCSLSNIVLMTSCDLYKINSKLK